MRLIMIGLAALGAIAATPAAAQMYPPDVPVCLQLFGRFNSIECRYTSIAQCNMSASGRPAQCIVNPYFNPGPRQKPRRERKVRREY